MKPVNPEKERIIVLVNQLLERSGLSIDQVVARMQIDGCDITRSTFENRFTTRVHQKPTVPAAWLLSLIRAFTQNLLTDERCQAEEAIELAKLVRLPLDLLSEVNHFFPPVEFTEAIEKYVPPLYFWIGQNTTSATDLLTKSKEHRPNDGIKSHQPTADWGEAPDIAHFHGRSEELATVQQWIGAESCRAIGIFGMSGIGKTVFATRLAHLMQSEFHQICWRSLHNAPPLYDFLGDCLSSLTKQPESTLPATVEKRQLLLVQTLRQHQCLVIIDNFEMVMEEGDSTGRYRTGYENYSPFLHTLATTSHQSCILLTSQEKPVEFASLEGNGLPVRALPLSGLPTAIAQKLLHSKGLQGNAESWGRFCTHYSGNPLALQLAADAIRDLFAGDIAAFLATDTTLFHDIRELIDQQFSRVTLLEREILYWLGIERKMITLETLQQNLLQPIPTGQLLDALRSLRRRSLIEANQQGFSLAAVVLGYITERLVDLIVAEISAEMPLILRSFALLKTQTEEHLRDTQLRLLLLPIIERLRHTCSDEGIIARLWQIVQRLQTEQQRAPDYAPGNLLNLLAYLAANFTNQDLSGLAIRQAHLHRVILQDVNFSGCSFRDTTFLETFGSIATVAYSPQGDRLAAGMTNGEIQIWQLDRKAPPLRLQGHTDMVWSVTFHPDGNRLASSSEDQSIRLWDVTSGECLANIHAHNGWVKSVCFSHQGDRLISAGHDALVRIWDVATSQSRQSWPAHDGWLWHAIYSPDDRLIATAGQDQLIKLWDAATGQWRQTLTGHSAPVRALAFAPNGQLLASGSFDHTIKVWDIATGACVRTLTGHANLLWSVAFSPDGTLLASSADDQSVRLWEVTTGAVRHLLTGHHNRVWSVAFHPSGATVAGGGDDQTLRFWDVATGHLVRKQEGYTNQIWSLALTTTHGAGGQRLASGGDDGIVRLWSLTAGHHVRLLQGHRERVRTVAFSPDGQSLASGSDDHTIRLWHTQQGTCSQVLTGHTNRVWSVAFHADGRTLASASEDQTVRLWDLSSGRIQRTIRHQAGRIWSIAFHPHSGLLAGGADSTAVCLWDAESGEEIQSWHGHQGRIWHVAFSPDGRWLASSSADCTVRLWEVATGICRYVLEGHRDAVWAVAFSPDSAWVASSGDDERICLWHVEHGALVHTLQGHHGCIWTLAFAENGLLVSGGQDETIRLWDAHSGVWQQTLRSERPYERMNITGVTGLTEAQKAALRTLGAIEHE